MLVFPLPILTFLLAGVACVLLWRSDLGHALARLLFTLLFALISLGALLVALRFGYGVDQLVAVQRAIPLFVGPLLYLGFAVQSKNNEQTKRALIIHLGIAAALSLLPYLFSGFRGGFDLVISASSLFYAIALIFLWRKGSDHLAYARIELVDKLRRWMLTGALILMLMLVVDAAISFNFAIQRDTDALALISYGAILTTGLLAVFIAVLSGTRQTPQRTKSNSATYDECNELEKAARELLQTTQLYLDTELSVERLAKRLHVPVRALSEAINQSQNMNVSQYVNSFRLTHASELLTSSTLSVTKVAEQSGFLARSNFYREFQRVYDMSPVTYRENKT